MPTKIVAEFASNHGGSWDWINRAIAGCAKAGVNVCKVQSYQTKFLRPGDPQEAWLKQAELSLEMLQRFHDTCVAHGVEPLASVFDVERPAQLAAMGYKAVKIGSGDSMREYLMRACMDAFPLVYASSGLGPLSLVGLREGLNRRVLKMYCTTHYPCPLNNVSLPDLMTAAEDCWGYSDHTEGLDACKLAIALDAEVVEKHLRLGTGRISPWDACLADFAELARWRDVVGVMMRDGPRPEPRPEDIARFVGRWTHGRG